MTDVRFRDDDGWHWQVVEHSGRDAWHTTTRMRRRCLYFLSRYETRRCDDFPDDWSRRSAAELSRLCEVAVTL